MTIVYVFIAVIVGWFIGFLDSNLRTAKKIQAAETNAEMMIEQAERKIAQAEQKFTAGAFAQDDPGLLRLKKTDGRFLLELDGTQVGADLSQEKRRRLIELITVFRLWLEPAPAATPPATPPAQPIPPASKPLPPIKKAEPEKNIAALSIVQQIDSVLQAHLADTPLAKRGIRLQESPQGGVEVYVGLQKFDAVDDVPDDVVRNIIRTAIMEWEKKYTPGM